MTTTSSETGVISRSEITAAFNELHRLTSKLARPADAESKIFMLMNTIEDWANRTFADPWAPRTELAANQWLAFRAVLAAAPVRWHTNHHVGQVLEQQLLRLTCAATPVKLVMVTRLPCLARLVTDDLSDADAVLLLRYRQLASCHPLLVAHAATPNSGIRMVGGVASGGQETGRTFPDRTASRLLFPVMQAIAADMRALPSDTLILAERLRSDTPTASYTDLIEVASRLS
jgi:hypothetical protein